MRDEDKSKEELIGELRELKERLSGKPLSSVKQTCEPPFTGLAEHIPGISIQGYRPDGEIVYWNRESEALYGYTAQEAIGKNMLDLIIPDSLRPFFEQCLEAGRKVSQSGEFIARCELILRNKQGGAVPVYSVHTAVCIEDREPLLFCTVIDFSDRKRIEEELLNAKKLEAIGVLAGGIAHDFNNLLFVILGNISMALLKMGSASPALRHLAEAEKACLRARDLTQKFITFSSGGGPVKSRVCMHEMVSNMISLMLSGSHVRSRVDIPDDLWGVEVDENQMRQVLTGILANAKEAMPRGGLITIKGDNLDIINENALAKVVEEGQYVRMVISDEGVGIPEENLAKIFDPYFSTKYRGSQKGMGFGLAIAHSVIKRHSGHITVDSHPGEGTTVSILIPASVAKGRQLSVTSSVPIPRKRVLVMDDEEMLNELIQTMLEHLGYDVDIVLDGEKAIETYSQVLEAGSDYAAIILDLTVKGGMGGREAIQKLLYLNPDVKAIVSSGYSNDPIMSDYAAYGFRDVLRKPYDLEQLRAVLDSVLG
ncbi:MAG: ATP-binding protein [Syntrophobacteraceae bacterium]